MTAGTVDAVCTPAPAQDPPLRLAGAGQLLAVLPHLLGYRLERSLVVVVTALRPRSSLGELVFTGRIDLPATHHLDAALRTLGFSVQQTVDSAPGVTLLTVVGYDLPARPDGEVDDDAVTALLEASRRLADATGSHVHDLLLVRGVRDGRELCPVVSGGDDVTEDGRRWEPVPPARDVPAAADLVLDGRSVLPSRSAVADVVRRRDEAATGATEVALSLLDLAPDRMDHPAALQAFADWVYRGTAPTARERACIAVVLHDRWVRDAVLARWLPDLDWVADVPLPEDLDAVARQLRPWPTTAYREGLDRLLTLVSQVPRDLGGPLLTLAAMVAWTRGDGTVANEACDLALEVDPGSRLALLLRRALEVGLRPPRPAGVRRADRRAGRRPGGRPAA